MHESLSLFLLLVAVEDSKEEALKECVWRWEEEEEVIHTFVIFGNVFFYFEKLVVKFFSYLVLRKETWLSSCDDAVVAAAAAVVCEFVAVAFVVALNFSDSFSKTGDDFLLPI